MKSNLKCQKSQKSIEDPKTPKEIPERSQNLMNTKEIPKNSKNPSNIQIQKSQKSKESWKNSKKSRESKKNHKNSKNIIKIPSISKSPNFLYPQEIPKPPSLSKLESHPIGISIGLLEVITNQDNKRSHKLWFHIDFGKKSPILPPERPISQP